MKTKKIILSLVLAVLCTSNIFCMQQKKIKIDTTKPFGRLITNCFDTFEVICGFLTFGKDIQAMKRAYKFFNEFFWKEYINFEDKNVFLLRITNRIYEKKQYEDFLNFLKKNNHFLIIAFDGVERINDEIISDIHESIKDKKLLVGLAIVRIELDYTKFCDDEEIELTDRGLECISDFTNLKYLAIIGSQFDPYGGGFGGIPSYNFTRKGLEKLFEKLKNLEEIFLDHLAYEHKEEHNDSFIILPLVSKKAIENLVKNNRESLKTLSFQQSCKFGFPDEGIYDFVDKIEICKNLRNLDIFGWQINEQIAAHIIITFDNLTFLSIDGAGSNIEVEDLRRYAFSNEKLAFFNIARFKPFDENCWEITEKNTDGEEEQTVYIKTIAILGRRNVCSYVAGDHGRLSIFVTFFVAGKKSYCPCI
jgi:hypothetical protein